MLINKPPDLGTLTSRHPLHQVPFPPLKPSRLVTFMVDRNSKTKDRVLAFDFVDEMERRWADLTEFLSVWFR